MYSSVPGRRLIVGAIFEDEDDIKPNVSERSWAELGDSTEDWNADGVKIEKADAVDEIMATITAE
jgi:hypothetical protein